MDGSRFDDLARSLAGRKSRRGFLGGLLALGAGLAGIAPAGAACPPGRVSKQGQCVCKQTGRPPTNGACPCPAGQTDTGDGLGCLACRADADCEDGNPCTTTACRAGACRKAAVVCPPASDQCLVSVCRPKAGGCVEEAVADGTACDDGDACTRTDACRAGVCVGSNPVSCTASDQCHDVGTCDPATGVCSNPPSANTRPCNDGNACTRTDRCDGAGTCVGSNPVVCTALSQCHDVGTCNPATGLCANPAKPSNTPCNDGNACTRTDRCDGAGTCVGGNPVFCFASDPCHFTGTCNPSTGVCSTPPAPAGTSCGNPASCAGGVQHAWDTCDGGGSCVPGATLTCDPYICGATACRATCSDDGHCVPGAFCDANGQCQADGGSGAACNDGAECQSGVCCFGACCSGTCCPDGTCSTDHPGGTCVCIPNCAAPKQCGDDNGCGEPCLCSDGLICCGGGGSGSPGGCCAGPCCDGVCCEFRNGHCCGDPDHRFCFTGTTCPP
jgi:hypothetical protein